MKKVSIFILGLLVSAASYAQQSPVLPYAPKTESDLAKDSALRGVVKEAAKEALREEAAKKAKVTTVASECPPPVSPAAKKKPDCTPKKPKPTPKPKPEVKNCPEQKPRPKCEPEIKTVEKEKVCDVLSKVRVT